MELRAASPKTSTALRLALTRLVGMERPARGWKDGDGAPAYAASISRHSSGVALAPGRKRKVREKRSRLTYCWICRLVTLLISQTQPCVTGIIKGRVDGIKRCLPA